MLREESDIMSLYVFGLLLCFPSIERLFVKQGLIGNLMIIVLGRGNKDWYIHITKISVFE